MKNNKTYYLILLDESGSMDDCKSQAISSFNEQLQTIKSLQREYPKQKFSISLVKFNDQVNPVLINKNPKTAKQLNCMNYRPNYMTALYDAIGDSVNVMQHEVGEEIAGGKASAVVVIITDGYENSSKRYTYNQIKGLIKKMEATKGYTFTYLGATLDAVEIARDLNIKENNAMYFSKARYSESTETLKRSYSKLARGKHKGVYDSDLFLDKN